MAASYTIHSPADHIVSRLLQGYWINADFHPPQCEVASLYLPQTGPADVGRRMAASYGFPLASSVAEALTLGTGKLAVDGVVLVGDAIDSPAATPDARFDFFQQVVKVYKQCGGSVPVCHYGYLSTDWNQALQIYHWSQELNFPLMAGSSPPVTFRRPELDYHLPDNYDDRRLGDRASPRYPLGVDFAGALVVSPGSEASGAMFGGLEILQSFLERRKAGETGIRSLRRLVDGEVWSAARQGLWPMPLLHAALARAEKLGAGRPEDVPHPAAWLVEYRDGARGAVLSLAGLVREYLAAFRLQGREEIDSTLCYTPVASGNDFSMLVHGISSLMATGRSPYPVERALLTSGAYSYLRAAGQGGAQRIDTPPLRMSYAAPERSFYAPGPGW